MASTPPTGGSSFQRPPSAAEQPIDATVISANTSIGPGGPVSMAELGRALEGRSLGAYKLLQFVGGGGMGAVFRALDSTLNRIVAVKVLSRQQSSDEEMLKRFRNEAQSAARLDHENIGRVHAVGSDDGWHYIVFEYIEGTNLRDVINADGPFDLARTIDVSMQLADALEHASDRDVVHRDIKPSNIIITPAGKARIVDMGLARLHHVAGDQDLTASGMTLGTFDYISPEQARDPRAADVRSDLYSLGCTIFFMLAGRPPFADGTMVQKLLQHQQDEPPAIESLRPDVPRRFGEVIRRLMKKDPAERYQRPAELMADLAACAEEAGIELATPRPLVLPTVEPPARRLVDHLPWMMSVAVLGAVVAGLWLRSRLPTGGDAAQQSVVAGDGEAVEPAIATEPRIVRVVDDPGADDERATLAEAIQAATDGDVIELVFSGPRDEQPLSVGRKRLVIRAAEGFSPVVRFSLSSNIDPLDTEGGMWRRVGCTVDGGHLRIEGLRIEAVRDRRAMGAAVSLFLVRGGAAIECVDTRVVVRDEVSPEGEQGADTPREDAVIESQSLGTGDPGEGQECRFIGSSVEGDVVVCRVLGGGAITIVWSESRLIEGGRFLVAEGAETAAGQGARVRLALDACSFTCRNGFASLRDAPSRPLAPSLHAFAEGCRFRIPEGMALIEQVGVGDPETYRSVVDWLDAGSRYEGSGIFRRIDGAAERVELDYASSSQPLIHLPAAEDWQDEAE